MEAVAKRVGQLDFPRHSLAGLCTWLILGFGVLDLVSSDQGADQRAEESLASFARVMDELKEPKIDREFLLRNAAMRPQPGAQQ